MARIGHINPRRNFVSTLRKPAIVKACQATLENLEDRRLLSSVIDTGPLSAHERHLAHVRHLTHMKLSALPMSSGVAGASGASAAVGSAPIAAPLPAGGPNSVIQAGLDATSTPYAAFRAVDGVTIPTAGVNPGWTVISGTASNGAANFPSAGAGAPVLQATRTDGLVTNGQGTVSYKVHFNAPGQYKLYVRDKFSVLGANNDNSMYVPPNLGAPTANPTATFNNDATGGDGRTTADYYWDLTEGAGHGVPFLYTVAAAGDATISFNVREANYVIDRVVLSQNQSLGAADLDALTNSSITLGSPQSASATVAGQDVTVKWGFTPGASTYNLKRATVSGGPYTTVQTGIQGTSVLDTVPAIGTYFYVVSASDASSVEGNGNSPEASIVVTGQLPAPTGVTTKPSLTKVTISWTPPGGGPTGFNVKRGSSAAGPFTTIGTNVQGTSFDDTTAAPNTSYFYVVSALRTGSPESVNSAAVGGSLAFTENGDGWSTQYFADNTLATGTPQFSTLTTGAINLGITPGYGEPNGPGQIAGSGVPANFNAVPHVNHPGDTNPGQDFSIRWEGMIQAQYTEAYTFYPCTDDGVAITIDGVLLDNKLSIGRGPAEDVVPVTNTPAAGGSVTTGTPIVWQAGSKHDVVMQYQEGGGGWGYLLRWSGASTPKDFIPASQVQAIVPTSGPTVTAVSNNNSVALSWVTIPVSSYTVLRSPTGVAGSYVPIATNLTGSTYNDTAVTNGTTYFYEVTGAVQLGSSPPSIPVSATPNPQPPLQVTGLTALPAPNQVTLNWAAVGFADSYTILRAPTAGGTFVAIKTGVTGTSYVDTTAQTGQLYAYKVAGANVSGTGPASNAVSVDLLNGVEVHYYNDQWWRSPQANTSGYNAPSLTGVDGAAIFPQAVTLYGTDASPIPGIRADNWSDIITGKLTVTAADALNPDGVTIDPIVFVNFSDDDGYIFIDGKLVASEPGGHGQNNTFLGGAGNNTGTAVKMFLQPGVHDFVQFHSEGGGGAGASAKWITHFVDGALPSTATPIPGSRFLTQSTAPLAPDSFTANGAPGTGVILSWFDNSRNEIGYIIQRSTTANFAAGTVQNIYRPPHDNSDDNAITYTDTSNQGAQASYYRVVAANFDFQTASPSILVPAFLPNTPLPGVEAHYFNDQWWGSTDRGTTAPVTTGSLVTPDATTVLSNIDNTTGAAAAGPITGIRGTNFSSVFTGKFAITGAGDYKFNIRTDDDSYLYVDGKLAAASPGGHGINDASTQNTLTLTAGEHNYIFFQSQGGGGWGYQMDYTGPDTGGVQAVVQPTAFTNQISDTVVAPGALTFPSVSASSVTVNWTDSNTTEIRYVVERSTDNFVNNVVQVGTTGINATSFVDTTVAPGTPYTYRVHAENFDFVGAAVTGNTTTPAFATGGSISGSSGAAQQNGINLAAIGTRDWAHWGTSGTNPYDHKAAATEHISDINLNVLGSAARTSFGNNPIRFSYTGGTPNGTVTNTTTGLTVPGLGKGFEFTAPADTTTRRLFVYVGAFSATGTLTAHLSDGSAVQFVGTPVDGPLNTTSTAVYTIDYKAASAGQTLIVDFTESADHGNGNITLEAAALGNTTDFIQPTGVNVLQGGYSAHLAFTNNTPTATSLLLQRSVDPTFGLGIANIQPDGTGQNLAFEAENGVSSGNASGSWQVVNSPAADGASNTASGGAALQAIHPGGANNIFDTTITYNLHFSAAGTYKLYARDKFSANGGGGDNSMYAAPSGGAIDAPISVTYSNDTGTVDGRVAGNYTWVIAQTPTTYVIPAPGDYVLKFAARENGYYLDRIVLSQNQTLTSADLDAMVNTPIVRTNVGTVTNVTLPGNATSYTDTGLTTGTTYYYRLAAKNGATTTSFSSPVSFSQLPVSDPIDHSTGFIPVLGAGNLLTDGTFETPSVPGATHNYNPTGGAWTFNGTSGIISPPSDFGGAGVAVDGAQYAFLQNNTGDAHTAASQSITQTVPGFVAGQKYVFTVFDAVRPGNTPHYQVVLDPGTATQQIIYTGNPTSQTFTTEYSAAFTTTAGSHVVAIVATGTNDNTTYLDQAQILPYVSGSSSSDLSFNNGAIVTPDGKLRLTDSVNNEARSIYETTGVPLTGDFNTTFDFQFTGTAGAVGADGMTFAMQSQAPAANGDQSQALNNLLSGAGGGGGLGIQGIPHSVAIQFNMYNNVTQTGIIINGASPAINRIDLTGGVLGNAFHAGSPTDIFHVTLSYNYATKTLTETILDTGSSSPGGTGTNQIVQNYNVDIPAILGNPGGGSYAYVGFTGATGGANSTQDILNWSMQTAPIAVTNQFLFASGPRKISMKFSEDVSASLTAGDLVVHNNTTNADVPSGTLTYDASTNTATWTFASLTNGNYTATMAAGNVNDNANLKLSNATTLNFSFVNGDADRDGSVGFADLVALGQHYGQVGGAVLATGDLDGDGSVGFADLVLIGQNYGFTLPGFIPAAPAASGAVSSPAEEAAVVAALPNSPAKTFAQNILAQNQTQSTTTTTSQTTTTNVTKPVAKPVVTPVAKPVASTVKVASKPVAVAKPVSAFSTTRIATTAVVKKKTTDLFN